MAFTPLQGDPISMPPPLTGNIRIDQRQLKIDGVPYLIKGICYNPVRKGSSNKNGVKGLITIHPTQEELKTIEQDFQMMHAAGINTIRAYHPITDRSILALLTKYHLRTIVPVCTTYEQFKDTNNIIKIIETLKNEPSTLIFEIGNEWNFNYFYTRNWNAPTEQDSTIATQQNSPPSTSELNCKQCLEIINELTLLIRQHDTIHPISSNMLHPPHSETISSIYPTFPASVDINSINIYHGLDFGCEFDQWNKINNKPFYIGETGSVAWNIDIPSNPPIGAYDPASQAVGDSSLVLQMLNNASATDPKNILIGGCIFEWCDEWYKDPNGSPWKHDTGGKVIVDGGPYPANCYTDEWFGIVTINRTPRPAYYALKKIFTSQDN